MSRKSCLGQSAVPGHANFQDAPWHRNRAPAVIDAARPDASWNYGSLHRRARERAGRLLAQGLRPGDLVAVGERPGTDLILMQHALARAGAALLPWRAEPGPAAASSTGGDGAASLIQMTGAEWIWEGQGANRLVPTGRRVPESVPAGGCPWLSPLALVVETSGSSGARRAAMLTAENLSTSAALVNRRLGLGPGDIWLCCLPLRHIGGLSITYRCALAGAAVLLREGFQAEAVAVDLERHGVTHVSLVPPMLARLLDLGRPPPPSLRVLLVGGQSLSAPLAHRALESGWPLHLTYGMTETASQVATSDRLTEPPAPGAVGRPFAPMELDCPVCPGEPAALRLRGPLVMAGYASPLRVPGVGLEDGWLAASDLACLEPGGGLRVLGRADELLVTGGAKVHPARVEAALISAPGVRDLAVVGVEDPVWGERLVALYSGEAAPADLDTWCRARLSGPERPRTFIPLGELPTLSSGKHDRHRLRELARGAGPSAPRVSAGADRK